MCTSRHKEHGLKCRKEETFFLWNLLSLPHSIYALTHILVQCTCIFTKCTTMSYSLNEAFIEMLELVSLLLECLLKKVTWHTHIDNVRTFTKLVLMGIGVGLLLVDGFPFLSFPLVGVKYYLTVSYFLPSLELLFSGIVRLVRSCWASWRWRCVHFT